MTEHDRLLPDARKHALVVVARLRGEALDVRQRRPVHVEDALQLHLRLQRVEPPLLGAVAGLTPLERLDDYCARRGIQPAVLKVDTETTEPDVFRGAAELLATARPWIVCEVLAGRTEKDLMEILRPFGYHWFHITDVMPFAPSDVIAGDPTYRHLDWLFAPVLPSERYWARAAAWRESLAACTPIARE